MTNYLSSAMLSAGASCFGAIIEIEKNMSQAEINALQASRTMMDQQPLLMQALHNSYEAQAHDQLVSGVIAGVGSMGAGVVQLGLIGVGTYKANAESEAMLKEPSTLEITSQQRPQQSAGLEGQNNPIENRPVEQEPNGQAQPQVAHEEAVVVENKQSTTEELEQAEKAKLKREKKASARYNEVSNQYTTFSQIFGPMINGASGTGKSFYDAGATRNGGTAQAMSTVLSGNQTAQSSNEKMAQTYKEAFTNASQVLAGIVSAQRS
jgi:hypothetical protein